MAYDSGGSGSMLMRETCRMLVEEPRSNRSRLDDMCDWGCAERVFCSLERWSWMKARGVTGEG